MVCNVLLLHVIEICLYLGTKKSAKSDRISLILHFVLFFLSAATHHLSFETEKQMLFVELMESLSLYFLRTNSRIEKTNKNIPLVAAFFFALFVKDHCQGLLENCVWDIKTFKLLSVWALSLNQKVYKGTTVKCNKGGVTHSKQSAATTARRHHPFLKKKGRWW